MCQAHSSLWQSKIPHLARSIIQLRQTQRHACGLTTSGPTRPRLSYGSELTLQRRHGTFDRNLPGPLSTRSRMRTRSGDVESDKSFTPKSFGQMFWASSLFGFGLALYLSYIYASYSRATAEYSTVDMPQNADVSNRYNDLARDYDDEVDWSEKLMFMGNKRQRLVSEAYGNVLEVSVGTGRNMDLYDVRPYDPEENERTGRSRRRIIRSLTFNDQSEFMVAQAEKKFESMQSKRSPIEQFTGKVNFLVGDAGIKGVIQRPEGGYDTIVQTMGVCSMVDAPGFLRYLGELCRQPGEKSKWIDPEQDDGLGGKILLLEHGRGYYDWLNRILDRGSKMHADHYGCWWNKDVGEEVRKSGLIVERIKRFHFGTTWEIVLRPART